jgi:centrosomal CEP192-like protein/ASPM-SPD-2-Hydin domain-containing protein
VKYSGPAYSGIWCGFCFLFLFSTFLAFVPDAIAGTGQLVVSPSSISFGSISVGSSQSQTVSLTNSGGSKITVTQATLPATGYTLSGLNYPVTLAGGQSVTCTLTFSPLAAGTDSGNVSIAFITQSNGKGHYSPINSGVVNVPVSGTGLSLGQLASTPTSMSFGTILVGSSQAFSETITNSGAASVTISGANTTGSGFSASGLSLPFTLGVGQSVNLSVTFSPLSSGSVNGNLAISSNASNSTLNVPLSGTGATPGQLAANPASLSFGSVATGSSSTLPETLTNVGSSALTISQISSSVSGFSFSGINPPVTLAGNQSVTFNVIFAPQVGGSVSGKLVASSNGSNPTLSVPLSGSGTAAGQLAVTPSTVNFGNVVVGTTQSQAAALTASNGPVTVTSATVSQSEFSLTGMALPVTIPAGYSLSFSVVFSPQTSGTASANVTFASNALNSPTVQSASGSGAPPPQHSVALTWAASTSTNVVGYNVYRGTVSGGPYAQINSALDSITSDTDSTVQGGQTYYYVVTAVDSAGAESTYSNQTTAVIPSP